MKTFNAISVLGIVAMLLVAPQQSHAQNPAGQIAASVRHDTSMPLRAMAAIERVHSERAPFEIPNKLKKFGGPVQQGGQPDGFVDPTVQLLQGTVAPVVNANFDGASDDDNGSLLGYKVAPPDANGDVGPNHYVQWINSVSTIFDKSGNIVLGPFPGNQYFQGLGGKCESENDGDPMVLYDELADRWLVAQFAVPGPTYSMCIAVSATSDPTDAYYRYEYSFGTDFPDYPKLGIWGNSYVMTTRDFANGTTWAGISAIAIDRTAMLTGQPGANMVRFTDAFASINDGAMPADADGLVSGPAVFGAHGDDSDTTFELWELSVDWNNPGASTFSSIPGVAISPYDGVTPKADQPGAPALDVLPYFTMHRLNVRDFGGYRSMVANHTVEVHFNVLGIRWYEFRNSGSGWTLYQEGTVSPDSDDRWMGSISINAAGDIALGYSRSSAALFPSIFVVGQTADESGTGVMNVAETLIHAGGGSQTSPSRWGDYSMMSVDPANGSFWYTSEYYATSSAFNFKTRIANFDLSTPTPAASVHIANITTGKVSAPRGARYATASVTVVDNQSIPVAGYLVTGRMSGTISETVSATTNSSGVALLTTEGSSKSKNFTADFCATAVAGALPYAPGDNVSGGYACQPVTPADDVHVESITSSTAAAGGGYKYGSATVRIFDDKEAPASGYLVTGTFSGDFSGSFSGTTGSDGAVTLTSLVTARGKASVGFCVSNVSGGPLPYDPDDNHSASFKCPNAPSVTHGVQENSLLFDLVGTVPSEYGLAQNYPNPFRGSALISFALPEAGQVSVKVYSLQGREVATLLDDYRDAGVHRVAFDGANLSAGIYLYVMESGGYRATRRMTLLK